MRDSLYFIRNYRHADFDGFVQLHIEAEKLEPTGYCASSQSLGEKLRQPSFSPERDMFVAEKGGKIVGFMNVTPETQSRRAILDCLVHPEHRRRGLARELFGHTLRRAREIKAEIVHVNVVEDKAVPRAVLSRLGFGAVRRFLELRLELSDVNMPEAKPGYLHRHLQPGEEDKLTRLQNRCFAGTWGYNPNTTEEIVQRLKLSEHSPEDVVFIYDGEKPIAYCWTTINHEANAAGDERKGRIYMIGVDPDFRGRGTGKAILLAGLSHLQARGVRVVQLTVDSENKTACALYRSFGFKTWTSSLWYEKAVD